MESLATSRSLWWCARMRVRRAPEEESRDAATPAAAPSTPPPLAAPRPVERSRGVQVEDLHGLGGRRGRSQPRSSVIRIRRLREADSAQAQAGPGAPRGVGVRVGDAPRAPGAPVPGTPVHDPTEAGRIRSRPAGGGPGLLLPGGCRRMTRHAGPTRGACRGSGAAAALPPDRGAARRRAARPCPQGSVAAATAGQSTGARLATAQRLRGCPTEARHKPAHGPPPAVASAQASKAARVAASGSAAAAARRLPRGWTRCATCSPRIGGRWQRSQKRGWVGGEVSRSPH